jgi:two-component system chemotaxis response regulator CheB
VIRVLIAEDSMTVRELLSNVLNADSEIRVCGEAKNGAEAVTMTQNLKPDIVVMDIHMPEMDGFEATKRIMIETPTPIVIVSASADIHDVEVSLDALRMGALALLRKPGSPNSPTFDNEIRELITAVKLMSEVKVVHHQRPVPKETTSQPRLTKESAVKIRVVAIAASTGGPAALTELLSGIPGNFPASILVVQHMSSGFIDGLVAWLNTKSPLRIKIAEHNEPLMASTVYVAGDGRHLGTTANSRIFLADMPPIAGQRPAATHLFASVAKNFGASAVGIILTGMGNDGVDGLRILHETGAKIIAQDQKSSVVFGMPRAAIEAGVVDIVLPLSSIGEHLVRMTENNTKDLRNG